MNTCDDIPWIDDNFRRLIRCHQFTWNNNNMVEYTACTGIRSRQVLVNWTLRDSSVWLTEPIFAKFNASLRDGILYTIWKKSKFSPNPIHQRNWNGRSSRYDNKNSVLLICFELKRCEIVIALNELTCVATLSTT